MNTNEKNLFLNKEGTLTFLSLSKIDIIYPLSFTNEVMRGGMFWCVPNFDLYQKIFPLRHGEYRKESGNTFGETYIKDIEGTWGSLHTEAIWKKGETTIETSFFLEAKKDETYVRPGIHPYFSSKNLVKIICGDQTIYPDERDFSSLFAFNIDQNSFTVIYTTHRLLISWKINSSKRIDTSLVFWTDNIINYFCVELCFGKRDPADNLPLPIKMTKRELMTITYSIELKTI